jgi:hypothetical protein
MLDALDESTADKLLTCISGSSCSVMRTKKPRRLRFGRYSVVVGLRPFFCRRGWWFVDVGPGDAEVAEGRQLDNRAILTRPVVGLKIIA